MDIEKVDYKKQLKELYNPLSKSPSLADVPKMNYIMIDGEENPNNNPRFQECIDALFSMSFTLKFMVKRQLEFDYGVMPLEGPLWMDDMS